MQAVRYFYFVGDMQRTQYDEPAGTEQQQPGGIAHEAGELHRLLVESVEDYAIFALDVNGYVLSWNPGAERFKGYKADEIIGKHFSVFYPQEKIAEGFPDYELREAARVGRFEDEGWRIRKDGTRFWANVVITALHDSTGALVGFAKVTRDLSERRAAEERARDQARRVAEEEAARRHAEESRERSERLQVLTSALSAAYTIPEITEVVFGMGFQQLGVDASALGLVDDASHCIRVVSDRGYPMLPPWVRTIDVDDDLAMSEAVRTRSPVVFHSRAERDARFPRLSDVLSPYEITVVLPLAARDRMSGAIALHRKTGPLSSPELDLMLAFGQQLAQALERARLYEAEQQARARADIANRAKSEFLAAMSHELRTPLNAIAGYADLIDMGLRGPVSPEQHDDIGRIKRSQQHLLGIINDILNFSRAEAGQLDYDIGIVPIAEVFDQVGHMIEPQAKSKGLRLQVGHCPDGAVAWADKSKVQQILLNLLSNAVKFTPSGSVSMSCEWNGADHGEVLLAVRDSGIGIPIEQLNRIFEPFVQVGRSLTHSHEGTGLGLAISRDLARAMGGEITVSSKVGVGSVFTLCLPAERRRDRAG